MYVWCVAEREPAVSFTALPQHVASSLRTTKCGGNETWHWSAEVYLQCFKITQQCERSGVIEAATAVPGTAEATRAQKLYISPIEFRTLLAGSASLSPYPTSHILCL